MIACHCHLRFVNDATDETGARSFPDQRCVLTLCRKLLRLHIFYRIISANEFGVRNGSVNLIHENAQKGVSIVIPRERVMLALSHREGDRVPIHDSPWGFTTLRWHKEGLPETESPDDYFGYEMFSQWPDTSFQLPEQVLEETGTYKVYKDANGATRRSFKDHESTPELLGYTMTTRRAWEEHKSRLVWNDKRVNWEKELEANRREYAKGKFACYAGPIGYDKTQNFVGAQALLMAMMDDPSWVREMFDEAVELCIAGCEEMISRGFKFDGAFVYDDLGYRNATFFSPTVYREVLFPSHKRLCDFFRSRGMPIILHSCGRVRAFVPMLIEAGFACLQPIEVKSGMDLVELKRSFGDAIAFMGGIDVRAMAAPDPRVIETEIATKIPVAKQGGGYIYHSDHSVPSNVSFDQYCRVIELVKRCGTY